MPKSDFEKMFTYTRVFSMVFFVIGPFLAGIIYTNWQGFPLLTITVILNTALLVILAVRKIEPRVSIDALEVLGDIVECTALLSRRGSHLFLLKNRCA
ncbi:MAG: hypothetical protein ACXAAO_03010 [Candidatus Thorarchaeota archaeon]